MIDHINCILCHTMTTPELVSSSVRDDNHFRVVRCLTCGHVQLDPLPSAEDDAKFYADDQQTRRLVGDVDFDLLRNNTVSDTKRRVDWLRSVASPQEGAVLDIGCGYGFYVEALVQAGYRATGLDVSHARISLARMHTGGEFINGNIDDDFTARYAASFHAITLFHVLEHVRTPMKFLQDCAKLVASGGKLLIEVPNLNDELLDVQAEYRSFYWQRAHLSYFDPARLELTLRRAGFRHFTIRGVQRYGLRNLLHWLDEAKPQLSAPSFETNEPILCYTEQLYRADRERSMRCDTLIAEVYL